MVDFLQTPTARLTIQLTFLLIVSITGWYLVQRYRGRNEQRETTSGHLTNFSEMNQRGVLSDKEFRTIKTSLDPTLRDDSGDHGGPT